MKIFLSLFASISLLSSCSHYYAYKFELNEPAASKFLLYENDTMAIQFNFTPALVNFALQNKLNDGIKINWDDVSLSINGKAYRVIHKETGMTKVNDLQPPTTIPPHSELNDALMPSENVKFFRYRSNYIPMYDAMFPTKASYQYPDDDILSRKGQKVIVFLPYRIADKYVAKTFYFTIADVYRTKKNEYVEPRTRELRQ